MSRTITLQMPEEAGGRRIDLFLASLNLDLDLSRSRIQGLIRSGRITVNDKRVKPNFRLHGQEKVRVVIPEVVPPAILPSPIPLTILYEDPDLIVLDKPPGMVVHPAPGNPEGTLVNALLYHCRDLSGIGGVERPGIVHRLDKDTSGVMMAAKNDRTHRSLSAQIKARTVKKIYIAIVQGKVESNSGVIEAPIGRHENQRKKMTVRARRGRSAVTEYVVRERFERNTLLRLRLRTGRTHQIRVHLAHIHHPVVGDPVYGGKRSQMVQRDGEQREVRRQMLHSHILGFIHPVRKEYMEFTAAVPADMDEILYFLRG